MSLILKPGKIPAKSWEIHDEHKRVGFLPMTPKHVSERFAADIDNFLPHLRSFWSKGEPLPIMATVGHYPAESAGTMEFEHTKTPEAAPLVKSVRIKLDAVAGDPKSSPNGSGSTKMTSPPSWTDSGRSHNSLLSNGSSAGGSSGSAAPGLRDNLMRRQRKDRNPMA